MALLFAATAINYIDRQAFSVAAPYIRDDLSVANEGYGYAVGSFLAAYTVMQAVSGRIVGIARRLEAKNGGPSSARPIPR